MAVWWRGIPSPVTEQQGSGEEELHGSVTSAPNTSYTPFSDMASRGSPISKVGHSLLQSTLPSFEKKIRLPQDVSPLSFSQHLVAQEIFLSLISYFPLIIVELS